LLAALATVGAVLAAPGAALAATQWTLDEKVTVRNGSGDFVLGYAFGNDAGPNTPRSDHFNEQAREGPWLYGWVEGGNMGRWGGLPSCGWVLPRSGSMHRNGRSAPDMCPAPNADFYSSSNPLAPRNLFDAGTWFQGTGGGTVYPAIVTACPVGPFAYANYDPATGDFSNRYDPLPIDFGTRTKGGRGAPQGYAGFGIRYYAGGAVLVKDSTGGSGRPTWFFMRRECVRPLGPLGTPQLTITSARWRGRTVRFSGSTRRNLPSYVGTARQTLLARFSCGGASTSRRVTFRPNTSSKKLNFWSASLSRPSKCAGASSGTVTIRYDGDAAFAAQEKSRSVRRAG
jgi:hypothetical protein